MSDLTDLVTETKKRREKDLIGLTNLDDPSQVASADAVITNAATWAIAAFELRSGRKFSASKSFHLTPCVHLTMAYLFINASNMARGKSETALADVLVENIKKLRATNISTKDFDRESADVLFDSAYDDLWGGE